MLKSMWKIVPVTLAIACMVAAVACTPPITSPPDASNPPDSPEPKAKTYTATLKFTPTAPIPGQPANLTAQIVDQDGKQVTGVAIKLSAESKGQKSLQADLKEAGSGAFGAEKLIFNDDSEWTLTFTFQADGKTATVTQTLHVTCQGDKSAGAACCQATQCGEGLSCVFGSCQTEKAAPDKSCYQSTGCQSGVCQNNTCAAPSCSDKIANGKESDVDCGSGCTPCADKLKCYGPADCQSGSCTDGRCAYSPGALLGPKDKEKAFWNAIISFSGTVTSDLAFHNVRKEELWVIHPKVDGLTIITDPGTDEQKRRYIPDRSEHFMEEVQGISFSDNNTFGTCGDSRNTYGGLRPPNDFMGPVLWDSTYSLIDKVIQSYHEVHLDMLHSSPQCMGIAAETANKYFVFNGLAGTIDWNDFGKPHVPGGDDHSDGVKRRFSEVKVKRIADVPSNLFYDQKSKWLYIADTGNKRIIRINVQAAQNTSRLFSFGGDGVLWDTKGVKIEEIVAPGSTPLDTPSGLALHNETLYVSDYATGKLYAFDLDGKVLNTKDTGVGANKLGGLAVGPDEKVYVVDMSGRILRIEP